MFKTFIKNAGIILATCMVAVLAAGLTTKSDEPNPIPKLRTIVPEVVGKFLPMVRLTDVNGKFFCSGTVIADNMVLTAGHCLNDKPLLVESIDNVKGEILVAQALPIMINQRADYGLITGNFTGFSKLKIETNPYKDLLYHQSTLVACGFPWGSTPVCYPIRGDLKKTFDGFTADGQLYPGMSGGPVIDTKTGTVVAVNSAVFEGGIVVMPLIGLFESLGL